MVDIITRAGKGAPLNSGEMDANLTNLKVAIEALYGLTVIGWTQDPDSYAITLGLSNGQFVGPLALPPRPWRPRGPWAPGAYLIADVVSHDGSLYYANEDVPASADFADELADGKWMLLLAGSGGAAPLIINATKGGAMANGVIMSFRAPVAMEMTTDHPILIDLETAPGGSNGFGIVVKVNGTTAGTIPVTRTITALSIPLDLAINAFDKVVISIAITGSAGAAADLGLTTFWVPN